MKSYSPQGRNGGVFDVCAYGAKNDGSADATAAFNAAYVAANTYATANGSATVLAPPGKYLIQGRVIVKANTVLYAYGAYIYGGTDYTTTGNIMFMTSEGTGYTAGCDNVTILGGIYDAKGQNAAVSASGDQNHRDIFCMANCRNWSFQNCDFRNVPSWHAIDANSIDGLIIDGCYFRGYVDKSSGGTRADSEAIQIDTGSDGTPCKNVVVSNCTVGPAVDGSGLATFGKLVGSHTPTVANTGFHNNIRVSDNYVNGSAGVAIQGYDWSNATITGNTILNAGADAIKFYGQVSGVAEQIVITGNVIDGVASKGILFTDQGSTGVGFSGCIIRGNSVRSTNAFAGIDVTSFDLGVVDGNQITVTGVGTGAHGIFGDVCVDTSVTKNNIRGNATSGADGGAGIQWQASTRCFVTGNKIYGVGQHGIWLSGGGTDLVVTDNVVKGAGRDTGTFYGIYMGGTGLTDPVLRGNTIRPFGSGNEVTAGVRFVSACTGVVAEGNDTGSLENQSNVPTSRGGGEVYVNSGTQAIRTSDLTGQTATTATDIAGLSVTVPAAGAYLFKAHVVMTSGATTQTCRITPVGPTSSAISYNVVHQTNTTSGASTSAHFSAWSGQYTIAATGAATATSCEVTGYFYATAAGTLKLQYQGGTSPNLTFKSGSMLQLEGLGKAT